MSQETAELQEIRSLAHDFAAAELRPHIEAWDRAAALGDAVLAQVAELGFFGMLAPESAGGMELDESLWLAALEELAWGETSVALIAAFHTQVVRIVATYASETARAHWLERLADGTALGCIAVADEAGECTATRDGEDWIIEGHRRWVSNSTPAGVILLLAAAPEGPTLFLVDGSAEGVRRGERDATLGLRPLDVRTLHFERVRIPDHDRVGAAGAASELLAADAARSALAIAAVAVGVAQAALDHARGYADVREQFGQKLRAFEGIQFKLADMMTRVAAARALLREAITADDAPRAAMAKVFAAQAAMGVSTEAVQVFGGYGYMRDYPVEKLMRDAKAMSLLGGVDELHRLEIAASLYSD